MENKLIIKKYVTIYIGSLDIDKIEINLMDNVRKYDWSLFECQRNERT